jgi:arginine:pyruvate transaminase
MRERFRRRRDTVLSNLANLPGIRCHEPAGGMFVMLDVRGTGRSATDFAYGLLAAENVSLLPGDAFGSPAAGHVRLSLTVPEERLAEACGRIARHVMRLQRS